MKDTELGPLAWDDTLDGGEESIRLSIFAPEGESTGRAIMSDAGRAITRIRSHELAGRRYAAEQLLDIHDAEWSEGNSISAEEFVRRLTPDSVAIHETGCSEIRFGDDGLFWGHQVGGRIRRDGSFQEAVVEG